MTAVSYPTIRRQRHRLRSIFGIALIAAMTIALSQRQPAVSARPHAAEAVVAPHQTSAELYATVIAP